MANKMRMTTVTLSCETVSRLRCKGNLGDTYERIVKQLLDESEKTQIKWGG